MKSIIYLIVAAVVSLSVVSCDPFVLRMSVHNRSVDTIWIAYGYDVLRIGKLIHPIGIAPGEYYDDQPMGWDFKVESEHPYTIVFFERDSLLKYGSGQLLQHYSLWVDIDEQMRKQLGYTLSYPPTDAEMWKIKRGIRTYGKSYPGEPE